MRRILKFLAHLYPAPWRQRYGDEFGALLDSLNPAWRDLLDVLRGAVHMQLTTWTAAKTIAGIGLAGALVAGAVSLRMPPSYISIGMLRLSPGGTPFYALVPVAFSRSFLTPLIQREGLYRSERRNRPMEYVVDEMRRHITLASGRPNRLMVQFAYPDAKTAQSVNAALMNRIVQVEEDRHAPVLEVLQAPNLPHYALRPNRLGVIAAGFLAGLLLGVAAACVRGHPTNWSLRVGGCGIAGIFLAAGIAYNIPDRWTTTAIVRTRHADPPVIQQALSRDYLAEIITSQDLYRRERKTKSLDALIAEMRRNLEVSKIGGDDPEADVFRIRFTNEDRFKAHGALRYMIWHRTIEHQWKADGAPVTMEAIDNPNLPEAPVGPNRLLMVLCGLATGLAAGAYALRAKPHPAMSADVT